MKKTIITIMAFFFTSLNSGLALDITINVPAADTSSTALGIQTALNNINSAGGGMLYLKDTSASKNASIKVMEDTLYVYANTSVVGHTSRTPYGMTIYGVAKDGRSYRPFAYPIFTITSGNHNIEIYNIEFTGDVVQQYCLAISSSSANNIDITYCYIKNFVRGAISLSSSSGHHLYYTSVVMYYPSNYDYTNNPMSNGCSAVWMNYVSNATIEYCVLNGFSWYDQGYPYLDGRKPAGDHPTMDIYADHNGSSNAFIHNDVYYAPTAAVYIVNGSSPQVWDNYVRYCRQYGFDIAGTSNIDILTNDIRYVDLSIIGLYQTDNALIQWNVLMDGGLDTTTAGGGGYDGSGAIDLLNSEYNNDICNNTISSSCNKYDYCVRSSSATYNGFHHNTIYGGSIGYYGGYYNQNNNTVYSNNEY